MVTAIHHTVGIDWYQVTYECTLQLPTIGRLEDVGPVCYTDADAAKLSRDPSPSHSEAPVPGLAGPVEIPSLRIFVMRVIRLSPSASELLAFATLKTTDSEFRYYVVDREFLGCCPRFWRRAGKWVGGW